MSNDQKRADHKSNEGKNKPTECSVHIESEVQIDVVKDLKDQHKAERAEDKATSNKQLFWTKVATALIFVYTAFSGWQLKIARDTFNAANRPYVGINGMAVVYTPSVVTNSEQVNEMPNNETVALSFRVEIKNFGPVPAMEETDDWKVFIDGIEQPKTKVADSPRTVFPGQLLYLSGTIGGGDFQAIQSGGKKLVIDVWEDYTGAAGHYKSCEREQYAPNYRAFFNLGAQCAPNQDTT